MSSNLDKSLDDIIAAKPKAGRRRVSARGITKASTARKSARKPAAPAKSSKQSAVATKQTLDTLTEAQRLADRIIISNLPTDVTEASVKEYFAHEIGPIKVCQASYNHRGQPTGVVSVTFRKYGDAAKAVNRFNGTSIDDGAKTMKVELVMDPSKRPLSTRLNTASATQQQQQQQQQRQRQAAAVQQAKTIQSKPKKAVKKKTERPARRAKKTVEELDAEMADYFEGNQNADVAV
ncbi:RNA annealing protein Yra1p [Trichomonascus vanleenenianus]|uniref:RNA-binding protein YRA1 n=1 Tax=Trichomonascus vanleenenianus TaxID=2268995 RepID=UPI003ECB4AA7